MEPQNKQNKADQIVMNMELDQEDHDQNDGASEAVDDELELSVDQILERHVGSFGPSQLLQALLVSVAQIVNVQNTLLTIFTDAQPESWRCKTPDSDHYEPVVPSSLCMGSSSRRDAGSVCGLGPAGGGWEWVGGDRSSIVAEWGLVCDRKFLAALPAFLLFLGSLIGSAFFGKLADTILGRKRTLLLSCILCSATAFATSFSPNIWVYAFLRFANGFVSYGAGSCCLVLSTEMIGRKRRGQVGQYCFLFYALGLLSLPLIAYPTRTNWRNLYKIISIVPLAYTFLLVPLILESPRWLLFRGRQREALDVLKKLARRNGKTLPPNLRILSSSVGQEGNNEKLWRTKWAAKRMVLVMLLGFGVGFVYYGIQLNVENLNFNIYLSVAVNGLMEIPAVFIGSVLLSFLNCRVIFCQTAIIAGVACISCIIFSYGGEKPGGGWFKVSIEAIGFMAVSTAYDVLLIYCVELFPTNVRNLAMSQLRQAAMLGASQAPLLVVVGRISPALSFLIFGALSIFSGVLSLWLPNTRNAPLYETLKQQQEEEGKENDKATIDDSGLELGNHMGINNTN